MAVGATMLGVTLSMVGVSASPAFAASGTLATPGGHGYGTYNVNTANNTITLTATAYTSLAAGQCVTMYVDITRTANVPAGSGTHYDIRAARTCVAGTTMSVGIQYEGSTYGTDITGINKLGVCESVSTQLGTCYVPVGSISSVNPTFGNTCTRMWRWKSASPGYDYASAGNVFNCQS